MWEINNLHQWVSFAFSLVTGLFCCIIYDIFRIDRQLFKRGKITVFLQDLLIWIIYALVIFSLMLLRTNGEPRFYIFLGSFIGFTVCRLTLSRLTTIVLTPIRRFSVFIRKKYNLKIEIIAKTLNKRFILTKKPLINEKNIKK
ncbi:MAG: spore cortex biosynthesis protein YabQ [Clostridia bacterium]|nr:spore cortex biosynthesis protein YabQ [Clostridia bacterium]